MTQLIVHSSKIDFIGFWWYLLYNTNLIMKKKPCIFFLLFRGILLRHTASWPLEKLVSRNVWCLWSWKELVFVFGKIFTFWSYIFICNKNIKKKIFVASLNYLGSDGSLLIYNVSVQIVWNIFHCINYLPDDI